MATRLSQVWARTRISCHHNSVLQHERRFISDGVACDMREDGRARGDYRSFRIETGIISNTNGSARLRLADTHILVGVKADVVEIAPGASDQGAVKVWGILFYFYLFNQF